MKFAAGHRFSTEALVKSKAIWGQGKVQDKDLNPPFELH